MTQLRWRLGFPQRKRESEKGRDGAERGDGDGGPSFCLIHIQSSAAAAPSLLLFAPLLPSPSPSLAPRSCYRYIRRSDRQIPSPPRRRREQCLPPSLLPSSLPPRVSNDSCRGENEILILRDDDDDDETSKCRKAPSSSAPGRRFHPASEDPREKTRLPSSSFFFRL